ncbi:hypothetical protein F2Q69_00027909 [Brassica cretica]|uniref:Uncharacterized protein n=1 Tax=Brassica cretica TaxID=69181 RepID=A0A8S9S264_BRACR|nr:hypothetical protein F2Q69_00027909 [Brassica cretica]
MQSAKQKLSVMASTAKERMVAEQAMARTKEEKEIAHQRRKAKEAEANMDMHMAKVAHAEEKLMAKQSHYHLSQGHVTHGAPVPAPAPVIGHGYRHNPPGVTSVPPAAYPPPPTGPHHHHPYGNV